jgi:hypothetical protein
MTVVFVMPGERECRYYVPSYISKHSKCATFKLYQENDWRVKEN